MKRIIQLQKISHTKTIVVAICFLSLFVSLSSCVKGKGPIIIESRAVSGFTGITNSCSANIHVYQDSFYKVEVHGQKNILDLIETKIEGTNLLIKYKTGVNITSTDDLDIYVTAPAFDNFELAGSGNVTTYTPINADVFNLKISGSGNMLLESFNVQTLTTKISGSGNIKLSGTGNVATHQISGSGNFKSFGFLTQNTTAKISGSGNMEVNVSTNLDATISGSGSIKYKGSPSVNADISGSGSVTKVD